jgi:hypothetical protein
MKKMTLVLVFAVIAGSAVFAQETVYVSAKGSDESGWIEAEPTYFFRALAQAMLGYTKKIIIMGTVDINSNGMEKNDNAVVFNIDDVFGTRGMRNTVLGEILITGKPDASGAERAVLSAKGSGNATVMVRNCKIRFEHIEISGAEGQYGGGLLISKDTEVIIGPGVVIRNNARAGILVDNGGTCVIDGGEVHNNNNGVYVSGVLALQSGSIRDNSASGAGGGVSIANGGHFTMSGGIITGNRTATSNYYPGGGVLIVKGGRFTMSGGSITNNRAQGAGGGVCVLSGGRFDQKGGNISDNTVEGSTSNVYRQ